ncbi:NADH:ubiquinone oxidoreductase 11.6kD subunit [Pseudohyphozyma bogoriensis]|nr:NADH:ubiquinone oxidoreductase 11.6kD subunit [Pseudohyphozyma bogoriensis]
MLRNVTRVARPSVAAAAAARPMAMRAAASPSLLVRQYGAHPPQPHPESKDHLNQQYYYIGGAIALGVLAYVYTRSTPKAAKAHAQDMAIKNQRVDDSTAQEVKKANK